ncbi:MAG: hypothetical protein RBS24_04440 [Bacilli bacterium]|nr:hypothetical protein [Bacilli bacterium]
MGRIILNTEKHIHIHFDLKDNDKVSFLYAKNFELLVRTFLRKLRDTNNIILNDLKGLTIDNFVEFYQMLEKYELKTVLKRVNKINALHIPSLLAFTESFFSYWRSLERYGFINEDISDDKVIDINIKFNSEINSIYQNFIRKLKDGNSNVYSAPNPGLNALMVTSSYAFKNKDYNLVNNISFVTKVIINTPFFVTTKSSLRRGSFKPLTFSYNPLKDLKINKNNFYGVALKVGTLLAFIYVHRDYVVHLVALTSIYEVIDINKINNQKPDLFFIYGVDDDMFDSKYYHDTLNDTFLGFMSANEENDYFGYFKDMIMTLHNLYMVVRDFLPIPGTLIEINIKPNITKKVMFVGDTQSGKYEVIEALNLITNEEISDIKVISDSFSVLRLNNDETVINGTEIGGFLEKDALKAGYGYSDIDRAIIMNPTGQSPKYVLPLNSYNYISDNHHVDLILYMNNYENKDGLKIFLKPEDATYVFKKGTKKVINQNGEEKEVNLYFANPLTIPQYKVKIDALINKLFKELDNNGVFLGEMYTKLFVPNENLRGINLAALALLKFLEQ